MDDPISALDSNVKTKIFEDVIIEEFKNKTRILVTHSVEFAYKADKIIVMDNGHVIKTGSYSDLRDWEEVNHLFEINFRQSALNSGYASIHSENLNLDNFDSIEQHINPLATNIFGKFGTNIIEDEHKEIIDVKWSVYYDLFIADNNYITYLVSIPLFVLYSYFAINISYSYGAWIENSDEKSNFWRYFYISLIYPILYSTTVIIIGIIIYLTTIRKSRYFWMIIFYFTNYYRLLHERMLNRTINAPINNFFDTITTGKILNRYSSDIQDIDYNLYE